MKHSCRRLAILFARMNRHIRIRKMNQVESLIAVLVMFGILTLFNFKISDHHYTISQTAILSSEKIEVNVESTIIPTGPASPTIDYELDTQCKLVGLSTVHRVEHFHRIFHQRMWDSYRNNTQLRRDTSIDSAIDWIRHLQALFQHTRIRSMADIPCGNVFWHFHVPQINTIEQLYFGGDQSTHVIRRNQNLYTSKHRNKLFQYWDVVHCPVPTFTYKNSTKSLSGQQFDLIVVRDALQHMHIRNGLKAVKNVVMSGAKYFALNTHPLNQTSSANHTRSFDKSDPLPEKPFNCSTIDYCQLGAIQEGSWYPNNINCYPFNFPLSKAILVQPSYSNFQMELNEIHIYRIDEQLQRLVQRYDQACLG